MKKKLRKCEHNPKHEGPTSYIAWHEWAEKRVKAGWKQKKCRTCKLYVEWFKPKPKRKEKLAKSDRMNRIFEGQLSHLRKEQA